MTEKIEKRWLKNYPESVRPALEYPNKTMPDFLAEAAVKLPERTAIAFAGIELNYQTVCGMVLKTAAFLSEVGVKKGDRVALMTPNCPHYIISFFAVQKLGAVVVQVNPMYVERELEHILNDSGAKVIIAYDQFYPRIKNVRHLTAVEKVILFSLGQPMDVSGEDVIKVESVMASETSPPPKVEIDVYNDPAVLQYTGGTTGVSKGAMLTHRNLLFMSEAMVAVNPIQEGDETLSYLPLCHIFEQLFTVLINARYGITVNFIENTDTVMDNMKEISPTVTYGVPRIWEKYASGIMIRMSDATWFKRTVFKLCMGIGMKYADLKLNFRPIPLYLKAAYLGAYWAVFRKLKERLGFDRVRIAYSGAAPISPEVLKFFNAIGLPLVEGYGQTEGTGVTTVSRKGYYKIGRVGPPLPGVEVKIASDGEILVRGEGVFKGYFRNPEATAETLKD
ncbi:MAG: AMP-binding protein [Peptococcaceae bacterium]|nr:AMP-binding protein [Peptococcaceae bacterium]